MAEGKKHSEKRSKAGKMAHETRMAMPLTGLQERREERGWSKAKAADAAGMDPTTYSRIERMAVNPFPAQAEAIARAFETSVYDLTEATTLHAKDATETATYTAFELPEAVDPLVELGLRMSALEEKVAEIGEELGATMASLGAQKARVDEIDGRDGKPMVLDRNGVRILPGCWVVDTREPNPAKARPFHVGSLFIHDFADGKHGPVVYLTNPEPPAMIAAYEAGRCPHVAVVDIVERGRKAAM